MFDINEGDLRTITVKNIDVMVSRLLAARQSRLQQEREEVRQELEQLAHSHGFSIKELLSVPQVQYRNPHNPSETWTGRGARPKWLKHALAEGADLSSFLFGGTVSAPKVRKVKVKAKTKAKRKQAQKYRNPATGETYGGYGRKPTWLTKAIEKGVDLTPFYA